MRRKNEASGSEGRPLPRADLRKLFVSIQGSLHAALLGAHASIAHSGTKGSAAELNWIRMLGEYLPRRYEVASGFGVDADGLLSHQIDVLVFDRQYSPFLLNEQGARYIPAESIYAAFEVKSIIARDDIHYAGEKVHSIRRLRRTSHSIPHAGGKYRPKAPFEPLGGILCLDCTWQPPFQDPFKNALRTLPSPGRLDLGCILSRGTFETTVRNNRLTVKVSPAETALAIFFTRLVERLQNLATVPAIEWAEYTNGLDIGSSEMELGESSNPTPP